MKKALGDWRIPAIFAAPVLLWAGLLFLILQPVPGSTATRPTSDVTVTVTPLPHPTYVPVPGHYPSVAPQTAPPDVCAHPTLGYIVHSENGIVTKVYPGTVCRP